MSLQAVFCGDVQTLDRILSFLAPRDLASLSRLDRAINRELRGYFGRMFAIKRLFAPFFVYDIEFRELQARTGALISGSTALQLFDRVRYANSDLDVYVEYRYALKVVQHICEREHYDFQPRGSYHATPEETIGMAIMHPGSYGSYVTAGIAAVLDFAREGQRVQVIVCHRSPMDVILNFHSTCVMNVITHSTAYSLFPQLTFDKRLSRTFVTSPGTEHFKLADAQRKYTDRGFTFVTTVAGDPVRSVVERWVGDSDTWSVPLTPNLPELPADCISINAFQVVFDPSSGTSLQYDHFDGPKLRFEYITSKDERIMLCTAWKGQAIKPRMTAVDVRITLDQSLCDALYAYRFEAATINTPVNLYEEGNESTLRFVRGGRTRLL